MISARPVINTKASLNDYQKNKYFESMISRTKNNINPNLKFETPINFRRKLDSYVGTQMGNQMSKSISNLHVVKDRPFTSSTSNNFFPKIKSL